MGIIIPKESLFLPEWWISTIDTWKTTIHNEGRCSARLLAKKAKTSRTSQKERGQGRMGPGSMKGFQSCHHDFIYELYLDNLSRPLQGYVEEFEKTFGFLLNKDLFQRWFNEAGPYRGSMWATSIFLSGRNSASTVNKLRQ